MGLITIARRGRLLKTGQTVQYSSELDDGYYEKGLAKNYTILTTGGYSGTTNIDLIHHTGAGIAFAATTPGTITDTGNGLAIFKTSDVIVITGSSLNNGVYNVSTGDVAGTIRTTEATLLEAAGPTVNIAKREALSNNCVLDNNTGLMWARYGSVANAKMGAASNGRMPWTGALYDIFQWCAAANTASLGGYTDWRIPSINELWSLHNAGGTGTGVPDTTAFPGWQTATYIFSSTTRPSDTTFASSTRMLHSTVGGILKTDAQYAILVRGGA